MALSKKPLFTAILLLASLQLQAQSGLMQNYAGLMQIPDVTTMEASASHLYILSEDEGLAVFRTYANQLQWLYTSAGMQQRGDVIQADARFAYLFGNSRRLTVLEPTSVLGVYSTAILPEKPHAAARIGNTLFLALGQSGLGQLLLESPETVDSDVTFKATQWLKNASIIDVKSSEISRQLFVLGNKSQLFVFNFSEGSLELEAEIALSKPLEKLFIGNDKLWGATERGEIVEVHASGIGTVIGNIQEPASTLLQWNGKVFVRSHSGKVWVTGPSGKLTLWKSDAEAGNYLACNGNRLWISENDKITEIHSAEEGVATPEAQSSAFKLKAIPNQVISYPEPLLLAIELEGNYDMNHVEFSYRSSTSNASVRKNGFYWQPTAQQIGTHWFTIVATSADGRIDSLRFMADVRSFNSPPRFSPFRTTSIVVNETYEVKFHAIDPEKPESNLIRYLGVDLPVGSTLNERNGQFSWKPTSRQVGEHTFKVIATDRLGAASALDITLRVLDLQLDEE